jgi:hypothetical protein
MALQSRVRDPRDLLVPFEPLGKGKGIADVALNTEGEGFQTLDELESTEGVEAGS